MRDVTRDEVMTPREAAAYLKKSIPTLQRFRTKGGGPDFIKESDAPNAPIRYLKSDLDAWLAGRRYKSTSHARAVI